MRESSDTVASSRSSRRADGEPDVLAPLPLLQQQLKDLGHFRGDKPLRRQARGDDLEVLGVLEGRGHQLLLGKGHPQRFLAALGIGHLDLGRCPLAQQRLFPFALAALRLFAGAPPAG